MPEERITLLRAAYEMAERAHDGQFRKSGEPFVCHPLETALILTDLQMLDTPTLQAALLHDVVEDSPITLDEVREQFGDDVAGLVDGVTKLSRLSEQPQQAANGVDSRTTAARERQRLSGGEPAQDAHRDGAGRAGRTHQAG